MTDNYPTPGPNEPVPSWDEYRRLREAVHQYLDHDPDNPAWDDIWRAVGAILGEYQRDAFIDAFGVAERADHACIRRLITGEEECVHTLEPDAGKSLFGPMDEEEPPHKPPGSDHATLWLDENGEPALYGMHVYPGNIEQLESTKPPHNMWFDLFEFAKQWGLEVSILPKSWYNLGSTVHVVLYPPERYRESQ